MAIPSPCFKTLPHSLCAVSCPHTQVVRAFWLWESAPGFSPCQRNTVGLLWDKAATLLGHPSLFRSLKLQLSSIQVVFLPFCFQALGISQAVNPSFDSTDHLRPTESIQLNELCGNYCSIKTRAREQKRNIFKLNRSAILMLC